MAASPGWTRDGAGDERWKPRLRSRRRRCQRLSHRGARRGPRAEATRAALLGDFVVQSVVDEEPGGNGTLALVADGSFAGARLAVVLEPTNLAVLYGHRGTLCWKLVVIGANGHGATGHGTNAIRLAADVVRRLDDLDEGLARTAVAGYEPPRLNVGLIGGGVDVFTIAGSCGIDFSVRYAPGTKAEVVRLVRGFVRDLRTAEPSLRRRPLRL